MHKLIRELLYNGIEEDYEYIIERTVQYEDDWPVLDYTEKEIYYFDRNGIIRKFITTADSSACQYEADNLDPSFFMSSPHFPSGTCDNVALFDKNVGIPEALFSCRLYCGRSEAVHHAGDGGCAAAGRGGCGGKRRGTPGEGRRRDYPQL